jgi:hypothetical protein
MDTAEDPSYRPVRLLGLRKHVDSRWFDGSDYMVRCPICNRHNLVRISAGVMSEVRAERSSCRCFQSYEIVGNDVFFLFVIPTH